MLEKDSSTRNPASPSGWKSGNRKSGRRGWGRVTADPERARETESLRLAKTEMQRQLDLTTHEVRRQQLAQALGEIDKRLKALVGKIAGRRAAVPLDASAGADARARSITRPPSTTSTGLPGRPGYLDWETQPNPFRRYAGAPLLELPREAVAADACLRRAVRAGQRARAGDAERRSASCSAARSGSRPGSRSAAPRWALRVNPSSGNLHPTEAYARVAGGRVPLRRRRARARAPRRAGAGSLGRVGRPGPAAGRADLDPLARGVEVRRARVPLLPARRRARDRRRCASRRRSWAGGWRCCHAGPTREVAALLGVDRDADAGGAEREAPACLAVVTPGDPAVVAGRSPAGAPLRRSCPASGGTANTLSRGHVDWPAIDDVARAAAYPGARRREPPAAAHAGGGAGRPQPPTRRGRARDHPEPAQRRGLRPARRRCRCETFLSMLARVAPARPRPGTHSTGRRAVHLVLFVHRVDGLVPGVYVLLRDPAAEAGAARRDAAGVPVGARWRRARRICFSCCRPT